MNQNDDADGLLSRAELEIELARLVLAVERKRPAADGPPEQSAEFARWFEEVGTDLASRIAPDLRPFCLERLQQIGLSNARLELTKLDLDDAMLGFTPADSADGPAPGDTAPTAERERPRQQ